jgi:hypothetical protein
MLSRGYVEQRGTRPRIINEDILLPLSHFSLCLFQASDFFFLLMDPLDIW